MSSTYSVPKSSQWAFDNPRMSNHAAERWDERTPPDSISPEEAFEQSVDVSLVADAVEDKDGETPDELYYYYGTEAEESYGALFLVDVEDDTIVTVYRRRFVKDGAVRSYFAAYNHEFEEGQR